ncbi:hypothetical protein [Streptomyces sp. NBC_00078]|uniref:hypothetical protein n=1 Tax=unclassified Streptomyces TaxID=2593676 RepID=UPI0022507507|nr:hypothetical protein [Streptomyces sp. NBC_00078]MCX5421954.1 hypothetical protein [Streptomyces sp. NBC_00078]
MTRPVPLPAPAVVAPAHPNGGIFAVLLALLRAHGVSPMRWLELARAMDHGPTLSAVLKEFEAETGDHLWNDRAALLTHAIDETDQYVEGRLGNNLLYTYRTRILSEALGDTADVAARACLAALREAGVGVGGGSLIEALVREGAEYHRLMLSEIFRVDPPEVLCQTARFNLNRFLAAARNREDVRDPRRFRRVEEGVREFVLTPAQQHTLSTYLRQFGTTPWRVGRLLTKVRLRDVFRHVRMSAVPGTDPAPAGTEAPTP